MHAYVKYVNSNERHANPFARMFKIFRVERTGVNLEVISSRTHKANLCIQRNIKLISFAWNAQAHIHTYTDTHTYTCMNYKSKVKGIQLVSCVGPLATVLHSSSEWSFSPLAFSVRMMPCDAFSRSKHISFCSIPQIQGISFICYTLYPFKMCEKGYIRFI